MKYLYILKIIFISLILTFLISTANGQVVNNATNAQENQVDPQTIYGTTYAGILDQLLQSNDGNHISTQELDEIARPIYGPDWINIVKDWKKIPDKAKLEKQELEAAET